MRVLIVDLGREFRGGQHQAFLLAKGLRERGHDPELLAVRESLLAERAKQAGISVCTVPASRRRFAALLEIYGQVRGGLAEIVHASEPHALTAAWFAQAHHFMPLIASRRIALPLSRSPISMARYRATARVAAVSNFVKQSLIQSGIEPGRITVVYDGVALSAQISPGDREQARAQLGVPSGARCIGNIAAFVPEKGHSMLLQAFARIRSQFSESILVLHGDGPARIAVGQLARALSVDSVVRFLPSSVPVEQVLAASDIFAFPSKEEPLGSALLAAMAHGLPVVAIARGGIPEIVETGKNGLLVPDFKPEAFASAMTRLLASPDEAAHLGKAARETVISRFSADRMVGATLDVYREVLAFRANRNP